MSKVYPELAKALNEIVRKMEDFLRHGGYEGTPIDMYLAGGMAVNYYCGTRYTEDVDASFSRRVLFPADEIIADYVRADGKKSFIYLDKNYNPTFALMHADFEDDSRIWDGAEVSGGVVKLRVLSPVDLAVSKISRFSEQDREDIKSLAAVGLITEHGLRERAEEALQDYVGNLATVKTSIRMACEDVQGVCKIIGKPVCGNLLKSSGELLAAQWNATPATGTHSGMIKAMSDTEVIQSTGQGRHVVWERAKLTGVPVAVGQKVEISRAGVVSEPPSRNHGLGR